METQADSSDDSCEEGNYSDENEDSDEIQTQEIDCRHVTEDNFVIKKTVKSSAKPIIEEMTMDKKNSEKKSKKRLSSKKGSRKRKQR